MTASLVPERRYRHASPPVGSGTVPVVPLNRQDLDRIAEAREVIIETRSGERAYRTVIWVVVESGEILIRSFLGEEGRWYRRALADPDVALDVGGARYRFVAVPVSDIDTIETASAGLRRKYRKGRSLDAMLRPEVLDTTLRLEPAG